MIKFVMATVMLIVSVSRGFAIPTYLNELGVMHLTESTIITCKNISFIIMCLALAISGVIVLGSMLKGRKTLLAAEANEQGPARQDIIPANLTKV